MGTLFKDDTEASTFCATYEGDDGEEGEGDGGFHARHALAAGRPRRLPPRVRQIAETHEPEKRPRACNEHVRGVSEIHTFRHAHISPEILNPRNRRRSAFSSTDSHTRTFTQLTMETHLRHDGVFPVLHGRDLLEHGVQHEKRREAEERQHADRDTESARVRVIVVGALAGPPALRRDAAKHDHREHLQPTKGSRSERVSRLG